MQGSTVSTDTIKEIHGKHKAISVVSKRTV
jgi:hypothetical protein